MKNTETDDILPEYNFSGGARGKHCQAYRKENTVKIHKEDAATIVQYFKLEEGSVMPGVWTKNTIL